MKRLRWIMIAAVVICPASPVLAVPEGDPNESWLPPGIRWEAAEEVVVELKDNSFVPDEVVFLQGKPYRLVLRNVGDRPHDLVDSQFYHSIVVKAAISATGTVHTPHVHSVTVQPKATTTLYFAAVKPGEFGVICSIPGHREDGMEGRFVIRRQP